MERVALVTGGAVRVGRAIVDELARAGWRVAFTFHSSGRDAEDLEQALGAGSAIGADLSRPEQWPAVAEQVRERFGGLDALVNNAGVFDRTPFEQLEVNQFRRIMAINLEAAVFLAHACAPMLRERHGAVVNLSDIYSQFPLRHKLAYSVSKAALEGATKALALEMAPEVRVNAVSPGIAMFPEDYDETTRKRLIQRTPLERASGGEDIARAVRFLIEGVTSVTGQVLNVDSGRTIRLA